MAEEGFAIPLNLTWKNVYSSHGCKALGVLDMAMPVSNNTHSLWTSFAPYSGQSVSRVNLKEN